MDSPQLDPAQTSSQQDKPVTVPIKVGDLPPEFVDGVLMREFSPYTVALGRILGGKAESFTPLGTGVLVVKANRFGILTAHHCLHRCDPQVELGDLGGDNIVLALRGGRGFALESHEAMEHVLGKPVTEDFGPDLTFIEILAPQRLSSLKAIGSFWPLDRSSSSITEEFGKPGTLTVSIGFPELDYETVIQDDSIFHRLRHMSYTNAIKAGDVSEKGEWDYLDSTIWYPGSPDLPPRFKGVSGGPVWGVALRKHKTDGHLSIAKSALIGLTFYNFYRQGDSGRLRAHFIRSIYDVGWRNLR